MKSVIKRSVNKFRRLKGTRHVVCMWDTENMYSVLIQKLMGGDHFGNMVTGRRIILNGFYENMLWGCEMDYIIVLVYFATFVMM
jgi:hypothetical protein